MVGDELPKYQDGDREVGEQIEDLVMVSYGEELAPWLVAFLVQLGTMVGHGNSIQDEQRLRVGLKLKEARFETGPILFGRSMTP